MFLKIKNYVGQLRLYSLLDLVLLLIALGSAPRLFIGALMLHIGFLAYLEGKHSHPYRNKIPQWISYALLIIGAITYGKIEGLFYILFSVLYVQKTKNLGFLSPLLRGLQNFFIIAGIIGYHSPLTYVASGLILFRNLTGDFRDTEKDRREGTNTIPVILEIKRSVKYIHLIFTIFTSVIWWYLSPLSIEWLLLIILIQLSTYNLTPR